MTTHLMIDTETLGTRPGAVVTSVALVRFSDEAHTTVNLDIAEQEALGLTQDPATLEWWMQQSPDARAAAFSNPVPVRPALEHLSRWINWAAPGGDLFLWAHGASFDGPLLEEVYRRAGLPCPWRFWQLRDTRTLYDLAGIDKRDYDVPPPHVALNDAIAQTRAANAALRVLAGVRGYAA